ncbi:hypothetical protein [Sideroxydans sp.]
MNLHFKIISALFLLFCLPSVAQAGADSYTCKILQVVELSDDGHIVEHKGIWRTRIGESFAVNRITGKMVGLPFGTEGWLGGVKVLNRGGDGNGYKALVLSGQPNVSAKYIYIAEQNERASKQFWGSGDDQVIFSGICM